jgi:hypothetical protein
LSVTEGVLTFAFSLSCLWQQLPPGRSLLYDVLELFIILSSLLCNDTFLPKEGIIKYKRHSIECLFYVLLFVYSKGTLASAAVIAPVVSPATIPTMATT